MPSRLLFWSTKLRFSSFPASAADFMKARYFVPASAPDMVAWSMPRIDNCSFRGMFAVVALAPRPEMAAAMPEPVVLKA